MNLLVRGGEVGLQSTPLEEHVITHPGDLSATDSLCEEPMSAGSFPRCGGSSLGLTGGSLPWDEHVSVPFQFEVEVVPFIIIWENLPPNHDGRASHGGRRRYEAGGEGHACTPPRFAKALYILRAHFLSYHFSDLPQERQEKGWV